MNVKQLILACWLAEMIAMSGVAESIQPANIFASGCVLQREQTVPVWGICTPEDTITVAINGQFKGVVADTNGNWRIELDPEVAGGPYTMSISGSNSLATVLADVYFGDVWILTGQSNMEATLGGQVAGFPVDYPAVPDVSDDFDDMRFAIVETVASSNAPAADVVMKRSWTRWQADQLGSMSAVGYFFARALNSALDENGHQGVPLGFIKVCEGGTAAEQWVAAEALAAMAEPLVPSTIKPASIYYNGMIAPMQDYPIKGVLWYQGEGNSQPITRIDQYPLLMQALIESWRTQWNNPDMPFYYVQLAPYRAYSRMPRDEYWPWMRESQAESLVGINTGMACIIEGGLQGNIHPPFKDRVGERLARIALMDTYGISRVTRGPTLADFQISEQDVFLTLDHVAGGLQMQAVDSQPDAEEVAAGFMAVSVSSNELAGFALCGSDQIFYWATDAEIIGSNQVRVSNVLDVPEPVAVRYAWQNYPRCNLFNSEGLPAEPFRTDVYDYLASSGGVVTIPGSTIIYQDDFSGVAGVSTGSSPEVFPVGFEQKGWETGLDGNGRLESTLSNNSLPGYRVKLDTNPLTDDSSITEISCTITMRTPTNDWVMIGFQEADANGLLVADRNAGPIIQFNPTSVMLRGGTWGGGNVSETILNPYHAGQTVTAGMTYHVAAQTIDLSINGLVVAEGFALEHEYPVGTLSHPVACWLNTQLRFQPSAADGGAYIDSLHVRYVLSAYGEWADGWGADIGIETDDYDGDGQLNIYEYGLGGDPTNEFDQGTAPVFGVENIGGTNWFGYVHPQLSGFASGLRYSLELNTNLVSGTWTNAGYMVEGTNVTGGALDFVTNATDTVSGQKYIRLIIEYP